MVKLEFHDPSGMLDASTPHAPRLASFAGKRIGNEEVARLVKESGVDAAIIGNAA